MVQAAAAEFEEQSLPRISRKSKGGLVVSKRGEARDKSAHLIGALKGKMKIKGNTLSTGLRWYAQS